MSEPRKTAEQREEAKIGLLTLIAGIIGFAAGLIAYALYHLIGLLTDLFYYGRLDFSFASPQYNHLGLFVIAIPAIGPLGVVPGVFAIAAMAAVFGTASRAPFASIILALEVTEDYQGVLPIIVTVVIAELVGEYLMTDSIMTEKLTRRGLRVRHIYEFNPLRQTRVPSIMSPLVAVDSKKKVLELFREMNNPDHHFARRKRLVVLKDGAAFGVVSRVELYEGASKADSELTVEQVCSKSFLSISENEFGFEALRLMSLNNIAFLVVVDKANAPVGYISRGDLIRAQKDKISDDTIVEKGGWARLFGK